MVAYSKATAEGKPQYNISQSLNKLKSAKNIINLLHECTVKVEKTDISCLIDKGEIVPQRRRSLRIVQINTNKTKLVNNITVKQAKKVAKRNTREENIAKEKSQNRKEKRTQTKNKTKEVSQRHIFKNNPNKNIAKEPPQRRFSERIKKNIEKERHQRHIAKRTLAKIIPKEKPQRRITKRNTNKNIEKEKPQRRFSERTLKKNIEKEKSQNRFSERIKNIEAAKLLKNPFPAKELAKKRNTPKKKGPEPKKTLLAKKKTKLTQKKSTKKNYNTQKPTASNVIGLEKPSDNKSMDNSENLDVDQKPAVNPEFISFGDSLVDMKSVIVDINDKMAVKKHGFVTDNHSQLDLQALAQYIQLMNEQNGYLPPAAELVKNCQDIVKCLARSPGNEERRWEMLQSIEEYLLRVVNTVDHEARTAIVTGVIDKFYSYISDPQSGADAATSIVLVVLDTSSVESLMTTARWMVQQGENGPAGAGLRSSLSCLYAWLSESQNELPGALVLGDWVMSFIKALEESERFDILIEVSVDNLDRLFSVMDKPSTLRQPNADVIFHVLASLRQSPEAFDQISHHVGRVLTNLASDSGQFSRQLLQNVVDILTATVDLLVKKTRGSARVAFKDKYGEVILCLERHMASRGCQQLKTAPWPARKVCVPREVVANNPPTQAERKVGLLNLGNTCYMNSVMQALLVTRRFSTHVMLRMTNHPYWAIAAMLFGKLVHSVCTKLDSHDFFETMRPPFFTSNNQHDSSEFLGYLFELLQSFENMSDENYDYSKPPVLTTTNRWRAASQNYTPPSPSDNEAAGSGSNRRSASPRPGGSGGGSSSSGLKRPGFSDIDTPMLKKRTRSSELAFLRRDSYIDEVFGGVLLTRLECVQCHSISLSRDVFRDLQLAFPDKPAGGQHNVQSLLEFYCSKERLTGDNMYMCRDCGVLRDAERSVLIETNPNYLILVLKNFKFEPKLQAQSKLIHNMYYNPTITMPTVRAQSNHGSYKLYAAVVHAGSTLDSGHYYTIAKDGGAWHKYNDDEVTEAQECQINELEKFSTPYLLFYRRDDIEEDIAPALDDLPPKILEHVLAHNKHYVDSLRP